VANPCRPTSEPLNLPRGAHVVTVNDYLARRGCEWMGHGASLPWPLVGLIQQGHAPVRSDGATTARASPMPPTGELGFDYCATTCPSGHSKSKYNEASKLLAYPMRFDSILVDESAAPLDHFQARSERPQEKYRRAAEIADQLLRAEGTSKDGIDLSEGDYEVDEKTAQRTAQPYEGYTRKGRNRAA